MTRDVQGNGLPQPGSPPHGDALPPAPSGLARLSPWHLAARFRSDVWFRLWGAIILSVALATGVNTTLSVLTLQRDASAEVQQRAERMADVLAQSLARPLFDINSQAVTSVGEAVGTDPEVVRLRVFASDGMMMVNALGQAPDGQREVSVRRTMSYSVEGRSFDVGHFELSVSTAAVDRKLSWQMMQAALSWLIQVLAITLALYLVSRRITRPLADVQRALAQLAQGDTNISLSGLGRADQIGRLSLAVERFRTTLDKLKAAEQQSAKLLSERSAMADRLKAIYEGSSDAVMLLTQEGFFDCNRSTLAMFGLPTRAEFTACHPANLSPPRQADGRDSLEAANERILEAMETGQACFDWLHRRVDDGRVFPAEVLLSAFDYDGRRVLQATVRDITERKRIEQELQRLNADLEARIEERTREIRSTLDMLEDSRSKLQAIVDTALDAVVRVDADGRIVGWNKQAGHIFGWSGSEASGRLLHETIVPEKHREAHCAGMARYKATGKSTVIDRRIEITALHRDGHEFPIELAITRVDLSDSDRHEFCAFVRDITQRRQAEAEINASLAKQRELNQLKARFVTMASHEFRTPLATILSSTELLQSYLERLSPQDRGELFESIGQAVRRMTRMLEDVLIIGKDDAERSEFKPAMLSLEDFFAGLHKELLDEQPRPRDVQLRYQVQGEQARGLFDEKLMRHIFGNLLSNALKYSAEDRPVVLEVGRLGPAFVISVTDEGIGIPEADLPNLFETFHRGTNVGNIQGTGLGLAIVKRSVDLHGGTITVSSRVDVGTRFEVSLPATATQGQADEQPAGATAVDGSAG